VPDLEVPAAAPTPAASGASARAAGAEPLRVLIDYASGDAELLKRLEAHLAILKRRGLISIWHVGLLGAGEDAVEAARKHIEEAQILLFLLSPEFLASDTHDEHVARALERKRSGATIVPILLRPSDWGTVGPDDTRPEAWRDEKMSRFDGLGILPSNEIPVTRWSDQDAAFAEIAKALRLLVERLRAPSG
jgi:hypothetical protein